MHVDVMEYMRIFVGVLRLCWD